MEWSLSIKCPEVESGEPVLNITDLSWQKPSEPADPHMTPTLQTYYKDKHIHTKPEPFSRFEGP